MINKLTAKAKSDGELAVRWMSNKAQRYYNETSDVSVYKIEDDDYCVCDCGFKRYFKSLEEVEAEFESLQDEIDRFNEDNEF